MGSTGEYLSCSSLLLFIVQLIERFGLDLENWEDRLLGYWCQKSSVYWMRTTPITNGIIDKIDNLFGIWVRIADGSTLLDMVAMLGEDPRECTPHIPGKPLVCVHAQRILGRKHQKEKGSSDWKTKQNLEAWMFILTTNWYIENLTNSRLMNTFFLESLVATKPHTEVTPKTCGFELK